MSLFHTTRTSLGYAWTKAAKLLPAGVRGTEVGAVFNLLRIDERWLTAGQPTEAQFAALRAEGVEVVINLAPHTAENALADEHGVVTGLGMRYVHLPVDFKNPTDADFERFCAAMQDAKDARVLVHCAANMRVSAFTYRYRCQVLGEDPRVAAEALHRIWTPGGVWADFVRAPSGPER